ncbi:MAG TPA: hypothetical protein VGS20_09375 [Candidatus Acidoferrales bacterium]|nr:hypothetical protein [Candidatus Acidoferrales bacterium]
MRTFAKIALGIFLVATLAWASDPWKDKAYQQWDQKDIARVLNDSPWVKDTTVDASWSGRGAPRLQEPLGTPGPTAGNSQSPMGGAAGGQTGGMGGGGMEPAPVASIAPPPGQNQATFHARWLSSRTMREALVRLQILEGKMNQASGEQYVAQEPADYQLVLFGPDMTPFESLEEAALAKDAYLEMKKSKTKLAPSQVLIQRAGDGKKLQAVSFSFPKTANGQPTVPLDEKNITFVCSFGRTTLKFNFDPQKMADKQGRDL